MEIIVLIYLAGCACVAFAGDQRTIGMGKALLISVVASPVVGALLILAWPSREEYAYWNRDLLAGKKRTEDAA
jgi:hypothetical protein